MNLPIILPEVRRTFTLCLTHTSHGANLPRVPLSLVRVPPASLARAVGLSLTGGGGGGIRETWGLKLSPACCHDALARDRAGSTAPACIWDGRAARRALRV